MPKMRAKNLRAYAGKNLKGGEVFNAQDKDVRLLEVSGLAEKYKEEPKPKPVKVKVEAPVEPYQSTYRPYVARDLTAEDERSTYKRKDLNAE